MKKLYPITIHHRVPESWGGNLRPNNAMNLRQNIHRSLHTIFQDATPIQRIRKVLEADKPVMQPEVYLAISNVLKTFEGKPEIQSYEKDCFNIDKFLQRRKILLWY